MNLSLLVLLFSLMPVPQEITPERQEQVAEAQAEGVPEDYRVGPGDSLAITVFGSDRFNQTIRISNSGKIHIPYLGILPVFDMTASEIQSEIARRLTALDLIKDPWVRVTVVEHRAHPVYILGEVMQPGQFLIRNEMNLMDLISLASGFGESASPIGYLYRRRIGGPDRNGSEPEADGVTEEMIEVKFQELYDGTHPEMNLKLRGGDVLYVPERPTNYIFVVGDVLGPGAVEIPYGQNLLASQAVAKAGGPMKTAKMSKGMLMRYNEEGEREELALDFKSILVGREPDFPLKPNDIIFIPGSSAKTLGYGLLNIVPRIAQGALILP